MENIKDNTVIAIAGTVGIGKSTLTENLAKKLGFKTSFENVDGNPYLESYYKNLERWGFHLQIFFLAERFKEHKKIFEYGGGFVQDRTIYEDAEIFARMNLENGTMSEEDFKTYYNLFESMILNPFFEKPDIVIYLEGNYDMILERIKKRGREMETQIDEVYWKNLFKKYDDWIETYNHTPILRINIKDYDATNQKDLQKILQKINKILSNNK